jgi:hypothetical protein
VFSIGYLCIHREQTSERAIECVFYRMCSSIGYLCIHREQTSERAIECVLYRMCSLLDIYIYIESRLLREQLPDPIHVSPV